MKIHLKRTLSGWIPADQEAVDHHKKQENGVIFHTDIKKVKDQRNWQHLKKYWTMIGIVVENQERYPDGDSLHEAIKWELDITEWRQNLSTGEMYKVVGSIAMDKMKQPEFNRFYSKSIDVILRYVLVGTDPEELEREVMRVLSFA